MIRTGHNQTHLSTVGHEPCMLLEVTVPDEFLDPIMSEIMVRDLGEGGIKQTSVFGKGAMLCQGQHLL